MRNRNAFDVKILSHFNTCARRTAGNIMRGHIMRVIAPRFVSAQPLWRTARRLAARLPALVAAGLCHAQQDNDTPALPLPENPGLPPALQDSPNPLLFFDPQAPPPAAGEMSTADENALPPLSLWMPGETPPPEPAEPEPTPAQRELIALARRVAGSVVSLRVWDEFGGLLTAGVGCFVSGDGLILTDASLLHPEIAGRIDYITTTAADGTNHRITGYYTCDLQTGVALLQGDGPPPPALPLRTGHDFSQPSPCRVVALSEKRGLLIADATVAFDDTLAGQGWLTLRGEDSPGGVGSPVLAADGAVIGVVAMKTPLKSWMNFALPCDQAAYETGKKRPPLKPLSQLPQTPRLDQVARDPLFLTAFSQVQTRAMSAATRSLLRLTKRYPRSAECWALLGLSAGYLGATPDALGCQRRALALDPQAGLHWHQMAMAQIRTRAAGGTETSSEAEEYEALAQAVERSPNDRVSWLLLATHHLKSGRLREADDCLRRLTFLAPSYAQGYYLLASVKARLSDPTAAAEAIARCLEINDSQPNAWFFQGLIHDKLGDPKKAAESYRKATRLQPDHPHAWKSLAYALKKQGRQTEAAQAYRQHRLRVLQ